MPLAEGPVPKRGLPRALQAHLQALKTRRAGATAALLAVATSVLILALNLATGILTARYLGPTGRGELAAIIMWPQIFAFALTLGLPSSLLYNLKCFPDRESPLFSSTLLLGSAMGGLAVILGILLVPAWLIEYSPETVRWAQWGMLAAPIALFHVILISAMLAREEFGLYNFARAVPPLLAMFLLVILVLAGRLTSFSAAVATLVSPAPACLWMTWRLWRAYRPRLQELTTSSKLLLSYGLRSYGVDLLGTLTNQADRLIVVGFLDPGMMGLYVVAMNLSQVLNTFPTAVVSVLFPKASGRPGKEVVALTGRAVRVSLSCTALLATIGTMLGPYVLERLYGPEFLPAVAVMRILLIEATLRGAIWILAQAFMAMGSPGLVTLFQGVGLALSVPLLLWLVPVYGLVGAGYALLIATAARLVMVLVCFPLVLNHAPPRLLLGWTEIAALLSRGEGSDKQTT